MTLYKIISRLNGFALDVCRGETQPGTKVITFNNHGKDNQLWYDDPTTGTIRTKINGFCLDIEGDQRLRIMPYQQGDPNQQWERDPQGYIRNRVNRNKVLDIAQANRNAGAELIMWDQNNGPNQLWNFEFVGGSAPQLASTAYPSQPSYPGQYPAAYPGQAAQYPPAQGYPGYPQAGATSQRREFHIVSELNGKVIDIKGGQGKPGDDLVLWDKHSGGRARNQLWYIDQQGFIRSALNDYAINGAPGKKTEVEPFNGGQHQMWSFEGQRIVNRSSGEVLDVYGEHRHDGATVGSWKWKDAPNQRWRLEYV